MKFNEKDMGSRIIETITSGLYDGNLNSLREYVQNSIDSKAKNVKIYFEEGGQNLVIQDDGQGMNKKKLKEALSLGISRKPEDATGWRGIGIWSGVSSCKKIEIVSKAKNSKILKVEIDCDQLRKYYFSNKPILETLSNSTTEIMVEPPNKYYIKSPTFTLVNLISILPTQKKTIYKDKEIHEYLQKVLPVPFNKEFTFGKDVNKWLNKNNVPFPKIKIRFGKNIIYRPPFVSDIFFNEIIKKEFIIDNELIAVGWFITTKENKKLEDPNRGVFIKKKGFTIGDENLTRKQWDGTINEWQYGEIHIISKRLRENAARNSFEYNDPVVDVFLVDVGDFIGQLSNLSRYQSSSMVHGPIKRIKKSIDKGDIKTANKQVLNAKKQLSRPQTFPSDPSLKGIKKVIDKQSSQDKKYVTNLEKKVVKKKPDKIKQGEELLNFVIENLPPEVKKSVKLKTTKGIAHPELSMTDPIKHILQRKTGLSHNEIIHLSKAAYGWDKIVSSGKTPHLVLDPKKDTLSVNRNLRFGVMVYTIHDLFINLYKHEKGKPSLEWFENIPDEEKNILLAEMNATIGLIYRLIEKSDLHKP